MNNQSSSYTYQSSGVDTFKAAAIVENTIADKVKRTQQKNQLYNSFGLFASALDLSHYKNPVILTGCDGVGTKTELLITRNLYEIAGKDLVAMSVNDVLTTGGDPLLFLDYIAMSPLQDVVIDKLLTGMCDYLEACGCILAGGETAEMPGMVKEGDLELSGFCVGAIEKEDMINPSSVTAGDVIIGYPSAGPHANGWSLIRRMLNENRNLLTEEQIISILAPTKLYHQVVASYRDNNIQVKAMAHITGGGIPENILRILPTKSADIKLPVWQHAGMQPILQKMQQADQWHTFNAGIGWVTICQNTDAEQILALDSTAQIIGKVTDNQQLTITQ